MLHIIVKIAGCTFVAKCGHRVRKGERYVKAVDYCNYNRAYQSFCLGCWNGQSALKVPTVKEA